MQEALRHGRCEGAGWQRRNWHAGEVLTQGCGGQGTHAERTQNMPFIFVTLEVSQLDMSALKFFKL